MELLRGRATHHLERVIEPTSGIYMRFVLIDRIIDVQPGRSRLVGSNTFSSPAPFSASR